MRIGGLLSTLLAAGTLSVVSVLGVPGAQNASAEETVTLRLSHFVPPDFILFRENTGGGMRDWIDSVQEASNGTIQIEVYPAQQLGAAADHYDMVASGVADLAMTTPGYTPGRFPIVSLAEMPFLITNGTQASAAFHSWFREYAETEMPEVRVLHAYVMEPMLLHTQSAVTVPEDLNGMNLRPTHGTLGTFFNELGASTSHVPVTEARDLMERGIVDGLTLQWGSVVAFGIADSVQHHLDLKMSTGAVLTTMNKDAYDRLSEAQKQVIAEHSTPYWAQKISTPWAMWDVAGRDVIKRMEGHTIHTLSPEQIEAWRDSAKPVLDAWVEQVEDRYPDIDATAAYEGLLAEIERMQGVTWEVYE